MNDEYYFKLNKYLNDIFNYIEKKDIFLFENLDDIYKLSKIIYNSFCEVEFSDVEKCNDLTFFDIINYSREIINIIDEKYLVLFDNALNNGELNFSYNEREDNYFLNLNDIGIINIDRSYNYQDIINLLHEFGHYLCNKGKKGTNLGYMLDEFIARYFEIQASKYVMGLGFKEEVVKASYTIEYLLDNIYEFMNYYSLVKMYYCFGDCNIYSQKLFKKYLYNIDLDKFNDLCLEKLELLDYIKEKYTNECRENFEVFNSDELICEMAKIFDEDYRYIIGTVLAFYPFDKKKISDIIDNINTDKYEDISFTQFCEKLNIDINNENFVNIVCNSIEGYNKIIKKVR